MSLRLSCLCIITLLHIRIVASVTPPSTSSSTTTTSTFKNNPTDRQALLAIKSKIIQDPQGVLNSWNDSLKFCEWDGITCSRQRRRVIVIDLRVRDLVGTLSPCIGNLSFLQEIWLGNNTLQGEIPPEIGRLFRLKKLSLNNNSLEGEIPANLSQCSKLTYLELDVNKLVGKIPKELGSLSKLQKLLIHNNTLTGGIPPFIGNLTSLESLNAAGNLFGGSIPDALGQLENLKELLLGSNKLTGTAVLGVISVSFFLFCWFKNKGRDQASRSLSRRSFLAVSYEELFKATDGFSSENLIGVGTFGSVYKGILGVDGSVVAVKVLNLCRRGASKSFVAECEALRNIRHQNLVKVITSCSSVDFQGNDFKALVYEYMPNGSLERWLHSRPNIGYGKTELQSLTLLQRISIALDVACALDYLHHYCQRPIIHCDLKPSNILLDCEMTAHVGDFGLARFLPEQMNTNHSSSIGIIGTIGYVAPEYGLGSKVSTEGDVYGFGILLLEMMTGKRPTDSMFMEGLSLHEFARMALPDRVMEVLDPKLLNNDEEEAAVVANNTRQEVCLVPLINIGVACSMETPRYRMGISNVVHELNLVRDTLQATQASP